ncbi:MAG: translation elongation factor 4 [bacterium]
MKAAQAHIRNFAIIAHIDHGKSTLADRLLEITGTVEKRKMVEQYLDRMDLERERGITIKAQPVRMKYTAQDGLEYELNLIDTPGHVDFSYEVSRSLAACEGVLLVVDASQGIEAQTLANLHFALEEECAIIPVVNKIDLPGAQTEEVRREISDYLGVPESSVLLASAKEGIGIPEILERVIKDVPPPEGDPDASLKALIFDSQYDAYRGVVAHVRIVDGAVRTNDLLLLMGTQVETEALEVGIFHPESIPTGELLTGEVGYIISNLKEIAGCRVGDTITLAKTPADGPLAGFRKPKPMVFCGLYPSEGENYEVVREALGKLSLNDSALTYEVESSSALGFGFRCGFLGLLHMEIVQERLEREFGLDLVATLPNVVLRVVTHAGKALEIDNPADIPPRGEIHHIEEPYVFCRVTTPTEFIGPVMELVTQRRSVYRKMEYLGAARVVLEYELPLSEVIVDLHSRLKAVSKGYASFDYEFLEYRESDIVKLEVLLNGKIVDGLCLMVAKQDAYPRAREIVQRLKKEIPRHLFEVPIQAAVDGRIIARESVKALRKDVLSKCYGGDITRKRKLLEKQKAGKKRMKMVGDVQIPQSAFLSLLRRTND